MRILNEKQLRNSYFQALGLNEKGVFIFPHKLLLLFGHMCLIKLIGNTFSFWNNIAMPLSNLMFESFGHKSTLNLLFMSVTGTHFLYQTPQILTFVGEIRKPAPKSKVFNSIIDKWAQSNHRSADRRGQNDQ